MVRDLGSWSQYDRYLVTESATQFVGSLNFRCSERHRTSGAREGYYLAVLNDGQQGLRRSASPRGSKWAETIGSERALQSFRIERHLPCQKG